MCKYVGVCVSMWVCVCVCIREEKREGEGVCVFACVCVLGGFSKAPGGVSESQRLFVEGSW